MTTNNIDDLVREFTDMEAAAQQQRQSNGHGSRSTNGHKPALPLVPAEELLARPRTPRRFLIQGILPAEESMLLHGQERSYKSFLTMEWCISVACGRALFGRPEYAVEAPLPVVLLDLENARSRLCDRVDASLAAHDLTAADLGGRLLVLDRDAVPGWPCDKDGRDLLEAALARHRPALVVIDNLRRCLPAGLDECKTKDVAPVMAALAQMSETHQCALALVHHDRRDGSGYSGSGSLAGVLANDVHVKVNRASRVSVVSAESMRNAEPFAPFAVALGPGPVLIPVDLPDDDDGGEPDYGALVLGALRTGAKTVRDLCDETGYSRTAVKPTVQRLLATGAIIPVGKRAGGPGPAAAVYGLPAPEEGNWE